MNVSLSTRNQWELIFSPTICDVKRATLHNIYLYHHAVCSSKLISLMRTPVDTENGHFPLCPMSQISYISLVSNTTALPFCFDVSSKKT